MSEELVVWQKDRTIITVTSDSVSKSRNFEGFAGSKNEEMCLLLSARRSRNDIAEIFFNNNFSICKIENENPLSLNSEH